MRSRRHPCEAFSWQGRLRCWRPPGSRRRTHVYQIGNGVKSPILIKEIKPSYTEGAMRRKVEGVVELKAVILKDGTVREDVTVTRSLDADLDEEAIKAAKQWEFKPGTKDGEPVNVQVNIELTFSLKKAVDRVVRPSSVSRFPRSGPRRRASLRC